MREAFDNQNQTAFIRAYYAQRAGKAAAKQSNGAEQTANQAAADAAFTANSDMNFSNNNFEAQAGAAAFSASAKVRADSSFSTRLPLNSPHYPVADNTYVAARVNAPSAAKTAKASLNKLKNFSKDLQATVSSLRSDQDLKRSEFKDGLSEVEQPILQAEERKKTRLQAQKQVQAQLQKAKKRSDRSNLGRRSLASGNNLLGRIFKSDRQTDKLPLQVQGEMLLLRQRSMHLGILLLVITMLVFGLIMIFSTSMNIGMFSWNNPYYFINRQYIATLLGLFVMLVVANIDVRIFNKAFFAILYYLGTQVLLLLVLIPQIGTFYNGQRRWLKIPFTQNTTFQPSEIAKVGVPFILGFYFTLVSSLRERGDFNLSSPWLQRWLDGFIDIALPVCIIMSWCLPISMQSHMSAVMIMLLITFVLLLAMRLPWRSWLYGGAELGALALALILAVLIMRPLLPDNFTRRWDHLAKRIQIFMVQNEDQEEKAEVDVDTYHSDQAFIAIASGGFTGTGLGQGKQKLNYLPEGHNDYIFSNIVEELGFVGGAAVLSLFVVFFFVGCSIVTRTKDIFARLLSLGYVFLLTLQGILSIAVNLGVVPPTGISLPFFSFGGTSNLFFLFAAGCILSISKFAVKPSLALRNRIKMTKEQLKQKYRDQGVRLR